YQRDDIDLTGQVDHDEDDAIAEAL
ncbi:MAG: hypothetical protein QOG68_2242, partial [Solirubrobacteraceae bacterium]|nr:hypothetical protein [Solirubrobacteraceae bacterium]